MYMSCSLNPKGLVMANYRDPDCDFDHWDENGHNPKLRGGVLLGKTQHVFAYGFMGVDGALQNAFIARLVHGGDMFDVLAGHLEEFRRFYTEAVSMMNGDHNAYWSVGVNSGLRVRNHPHLNILRRMPGKPSSGMGPGLLAKTYDRFVWGARELADRYQHSCPEVAAELRDLVS